MPNEIAGTDGKTLSNTLNILCDTILITNSFVSEYTQNATSYTGLTGAICTVGGMSIAKDLYVGGTVYATITGTITNALHLESHTWEAPMDLGTTTPAAAFLTTMQASGNVTVTSTSDSATPTSNSIYTAGSVYVTKNVYVGSNLYIPSAHYLYIRDAFNGLVYSNANFADGPFLFGGSGGQLGVCTSPSSTLYYALQWTTTNVQIPYSTSSTSPTTGALIVTGGIGVSGATYTLGIIRSSNSTNASSANGLSGAIGSTGGISVAQDIWMGGALNVLNANQKIFYSGYADGLYFQSPTSSFFFCTAGDVAALGTKFQAYPQLYVVASTNSTNASGTTGSLCTLGGASIAQDLWVGGTVHATVTGTITNALHLESYTWEVPATIGSVTPGAAHFTTIDTSSNAQINGVLYLGNLSNFLVYHSGFNGVEVHSDTQGYLTAGAFPVNVLSYTTTQVAIIPNTNSSDASGSTGSLCTLGGVSVAKDIWTGGTLFFTAANYLKYDSGTSSVLLHANSQFLLQCASTTVAQVTAASLYVSISTNATGDSGASGAICTTGGLSVHLDAYVGGTMNVTGITKCLPTVNTV
jgi:hypothetical protein